MLASYVEPNSTLLNLIKKAKSPYPNEVIRLFSRSDVAFSFDQAWCNYLYLNGVLDFAPTTHASGSRILVCRFSCPFVQLRLYNAFTNDLVRPSQVPALEPLDTLSEVWTENGIDAPALCQKYIAYLERLNAAGQNPFAQDERRRDLGLREAVGHFHLYFWLKDALGHTGRVRPEFPTGNGKVDLLLEYGPHRAVIEVKSFTQAADMARAQKQAARYAKSQNLEVATIALFVPSTDPQVLNALCSDQPHDGVRVVTVAIGWQA